MKYCGHVQGEIKKVKQDLTTKKVRENLTQEELVNEETIQKEQLVEIFKLVQSQEDKFGPSSMDDIHEQMKLYSCLK